MNQAESNDNLLDAVNVALRALQDFRNSSALSHSFCYGQQGEIGTPELIGALRELQRHIANQGA